MWFPFAKARIWSLLHLWCTSGITPLKSGAELWINRELHLSPQSCHSDGSQELKSRELCQFYKGQAGGDLGSEPVFQSMPLPLWFSSSVISAVFSGSCWLLPHSQNNACWLIKSNHWDSQLEPVWMSCMLNSFSKYKEPFCLIFYFFFFSSARHSPTCKMQGLFGLVREISAFRTSVVIIIMTQQGFLACFAWK